MKELIRSNDAVLISFVRSLLQDARIEYAHLDQNMSIMEGSIGVLQQRIMVDEDDHAQARRLLLDADIELPDERG